MKFLLAIATIVAAVTQSYAQTSVSTTLIVTPCLANKTAGNDMVSRSNPAGPTTPCATLLVVKSNGTVTMTPGGMGPKPGALSSAGKGGATSSGYVASTATPVPSSFEGSASKNAAVGGGFLVAIGMAALLL